MEKPCYGLKAGKSIGGNDECGKGYNKGKERGLSSLIIVGVILIGVLWNIGGAQWESVGRVPLPEYYFTFLATSPSGDLLAVTFNTSDNQNSRGIPALLIKEPLSPQPKIMELCRVEFPVSRGYSGLACDELGQFWVSGDTGFTDSSFVKKFKQDGKPDILFGTNGNIFPQRRCLGLDVIGNYLLVSVDWAEIYIYNKDTGALLSKIPKPVSKEVIYIRDISIDPVTLNIYGVATGSVYVWEGGTPGMPQGYKFSKINQGFTQTQAGEGISFDPFERCAIHSPHPGNQLIKVGKDLGAQRFLINGVTEKTHLCDNAVSYDGTTVFVSDLGKSCIHALKRTSVPEKQKNSNQTASASASGSSANTNTSSNYQIAANIQTAKWIRSYFEIMDNARIYKLPMIVYFRSESIQKCHELEQNVLLSSEFNQLAQGYVCVFEDVRKSRLLAYKFGVYKVPSIIILDRNGEPQTRISGNIMRDTLFSAMQFGK